MCALLLGHVGGWAAGRQERPCQRSSSIRSPRSLLPTGASMAYTWAETSGLLPAGAFNPSKKDLIVRGPLALDHGAVLSFTLTATLQVYEVVVAGWLGWHVSCVVAAVAGLFCK